MYPRRYSHAADADLLDRLTRAAARADAAMREHPARVARLSGRLTLELGFSEIDAELVAGAARYHDIGNIAVPEELLARPGPLCRFERRIVECHTTMGAQILSGGRSPLLRVAAQVALTHHERWDGGGYPHRLAGAAIPLVGRIVAVVDAWDAMTNSGPHRIASAVTEALIELGQHAGTQFDPVVVDALIRVLATEEAALASARGRSARRPLSSQSSQM